MEKRSIHQLKLHYKNILSKPILILFTNMGTLQFGRMTNQRLPHSFTTVNTF